MLALVVGDEALQVADGERRAWPRMQPPSHCVSCGQTRPVIAGRALSSRILAAAPSSRRRRSAATKSLILTPTGQPRVQVGLAHSRQRIASMVAPRRSKPRLTSSKLRARARPAARACAGAGSSSALWAAACGSGSWCSELLGLARTSGCCGSSGTPRGLPESCSSACSRYSLQRLSSCSVHPVALGEDVEVHGVRVELGAVHAGELALP